MVTPEDTKVLTLGKPKIPTPLKITSHGEESPSEFFSEQASVRYKVVYNSRHERPDNVTFERAGPRPQIFFEPSQTKAAIVTCGGICPGLNNVIRSVFLELYFNYGVHHILGIRYGFEGLVPQAGQPPILLTPSIMDDAHEKGGTILGTSRGPQDVAVMADFLEKEGINILFCVGGDGTQRGAHKLSEELQRRGKPIAIVGIPKTIDNDIPFVSQSFGFNTAIEVARYVLDCAHTESRSVYNGIGLVKLMGRSAGFVTAGAALASQQANFVLIPEVPFNLDGPTGFLENLHQRIIQRHHAVVVVAEGAGQSLLSGKTEYDASGNPRLKDIGNYLREQIAQYFQTKKTPLEIKYIDPSYMIRSVPANCQDSILCDQFARLAVHAAMAGKTDVLIGRTNNVFIHVPIPLVTRESKRIWPDSALWLHVISATGQPNFSK